MIWTDERFKNLSEGENCEYFVLEFAESKKVWTPKIFFYNLQKKAKNLQFY